MQFIKKYPLMLLFAVLILTGYLIDITKPDKSFSDMENRYLQQFPHLSPRTVLDNTFTQKYETYINDQFIARDAWITLKSMSEAALGKIENNGIVFGTEGQMFEKNFTINTERVESNTKFVEEFAAAHPDTPVHLMLIPSAYSILKDSVPTGLPNVDQLAAIDTVYRQIKQSNLTTTDVASALAEYKGEYIYYRTDHHWTTLGAYRGYQAVCADLQIKPISLERFQKNSVEGFYGTHFSKAKSFNAVPDTLSWYDIPDITATIDDAPVDGIYDLSMAEKRDKYALFLRGNNGLTHISSPASAEKKGSILVIKDSYANSMVPFLTANYAEITVVDLRSLNKLLSEQIAEQEYDDILVMYSLNNFASDVNISKIKL